MNRKGFTLVELLATIVLLSIVAGIVVVSMNVNLSKTKEKTEEVYVDSLRDAMDMYLSSSFSELKTSEECSNEISKKYGSVKVYKVVNKDGNLLTFKDVMDSKYKPLTKSEFVNPANEDTECNDLAEINVYRDEDYVYYYNVSKSDLDCLLNINSEYGTVISNLPEGYTCD